MAVHTTGVRTDMRKRMAYGRMRNTDMSDARGIEMTAADVNATEMATADVNTADMRPTEMATTDVNAANMTPTEVAAPARMATSSGMPAWMSATFGGKSGAARQGERKDNHTAAGCEFPASGLKNTFGERFHQNPSMSHGKRNAGSTVPAPRRDAAAHQTIPSVFNRSFE